MSQDFENKDGIKLGCEIIMYLLLADDLHVVLMSETVEGLQRQINRLPQYCSRNQLTVNTSKTKVMVFGRKPGILHSSFESSPVEIVTQYKYLGVMFSPCTTLKGNPFKNNHEYLAENAGKSVYGLFGYATTLGRLPVRTSLTLFDSLVKPILEYGSEIWGTSGSLDCLEKVQLHFIKTVLGVKLNTSSLMCYSECGRFPMQLSIFCKIIKYLVNLNLKNENTIVSKAYKHLCYLDSIGCLNWVQHDKI